MQTDSGLQGAMVLRGAVLHPHPLMRPQRIHTTQKEEEDDAGQVLLRVVLA